jgi:ABC-2 type transport system permease protein
MTNARAHLAAIAQLRWRMFVHSRQSRRGKAETASGIFISLLIFLGGLGGALGLGSAAYYFTSQRQVAWIGLLLWSVFVFWQFFPVASSAFSESMDSSTFLRFPLSYSSYSLVMIAYGAFDPATGLGSLWLIGITVGVGIANPRLLPWTALVLAVFAVVNILLTRAVFSWIERWLAQRRTRELMGIVVLLLIIGSQFIGPLVERYGGQRNTRTMQVARELSPVQRALPPGMASAAIADMSEGKELAGFSYLLLECGYGVLFLMILSRRLKAQYSGENLSETAVAKPLDPSDKQTRESWHIPGLSGPLTAMLEKELHYLSRSGPMLFTLIMPVIMLLVFRVGPAGSGRNGNGFLMRAPNLAFPIGAAYAMLILTNLVYNNLGPDGGGLQFYFASPVRFHEIVLGKNLAHLSVLIFEILLVWVGVSVVYRAPAVDVALATIAGILFAAPVNLSAGNLLSVYAPKKVDFGTFGRQRAAQTTILASFAVQIVTFGVGALIFLLSLHAGRLWLGGLALLLLAAVAWLGYGVILKRMDQIALQRREILITELSRS